MSTEDPTTDQTTEETKCGYRLFLDSVATVMRFAAHATLIDDARKVLVDIFDDWHM